MRDLNFFGSDGKFVYIYKYIIFVIFVKRLLFSLHTILFLLAGAPWILPFL